MSPARFTQTLLKVSNGGMNPRGLYPRLRFRSSLGLKRGALRSADDVVVPTSYLKGQLTKHLRTRKSSPDVGVLAIFNRVCQDNVKITKSGSKRPRADTNLMAQPRTADGRLDKPFLWAPLIAVHGLLCELNLTGRMNTVSRWTPLYPAYSSRSLTTCICYPIPPR